MRLLHKLPEVYRGSELEEHSMIHLSKSAQFGPHFSKVSWKYFISLTATILAIAYAGQAQEPSLQIGEIFSLQPEEGSVIERPAQPFTSGSTILIPTTSNWRTPPADDDAKDEVANIAYEKLAGLEGLDKLRVLPRKDPRFVNQPGLDDRGLISSVQSSSGALIELQTTFNQLRTAYRFVLVDDPDGKGSEISDLTVLHSPGMVEQFVLPPGRWFLERRVWRTDLENAFIEQIYPPQLLEKGRRYLLTTAREDESEYMDRLRARSQSNTFGGLSLEQFGVSSSPSPAGKPE